ncbi:hypothetical protein [Paraclostridium tenue]|uniref:SIR2-like domain-containing protein n=1 Tax=Paraclostridium tenue TaxID=1737 RepID=A0ABN1M2T3_9FIRM
MSEINILELDEILSNNRCAFLCGNGFSMNFDDDFRNIFERLYESHKKVIYKSIFDINPKVKNKILKSQYKKNFNNILSYTRNFNEKQFYKIFDDGLKFAETIITNDSLLNQIKDNELIRELVFGENQLTMLKELYNVGKNYGVRSINIEYWPILIYFYFAIYLLNPSDYEFPECNSFITLIKVGSEDMINLTQQNTLMERCEDFVYSSGFNNYYRMLFSIAIFSEGKHLNLSNLNNIKNLNADKIKCFLSKYEEIFTLNYDILLEKLMTNREIHHLHGKFIINEKEYVYNQTLGMEFGDGDYVSFSNILVGDYLINKTMRQIINNLSQKYDYNKKEESYKKILENTIKNKNLDTFVIFGMNIQNDQHILRTLMTGFFFANIINPTIVYCYFSEEDKLSFKKTFDSVITFGDELSNYSRNINLKFIKTPELLNVYFKNTITELN